MNPPSLLAFNVNWPGLLYGLNLLYLFSAILAIDLNNITIIVIQMLYFYIFFLLSIITKRIMCSTRVYYIDCFKNRIKSFSIDNINNRSSRVVLLEINGLFIILSDHNINNKTAIRVFITGITSEDNGSINKFFILDYDCVFK